jgi:hypothetical protein
LLGVDTDTLGEVELGQPLLFTQLNEAGCKIGNSDRVLRH